MQKASEAICYFDIYPKVVPEGKPVEFTIRNRGYMGDFPEEVLVRFDALQERYYPLDDTPRQHSEIRLKPSPDGALRFTHTFQGEQEHYVRVFTADAARRICEISVYSLLDDLVGKIPLLGDQHLHTCRSDGQETPARLAATCRERGYDYVSITDHHNMAGSLEAIDAYRDVPINLNLIPGEEVHLPDCPIHVVHMGGSYSVNAMTEDNIEYAEKKSPGCVSRYPQVFRKGAGTAFPGTMSVDDFHTLINDYARGLTIPEGLPRFTYAGYHWICNQIREAGGLSMFAHPYWIYDTYHVDERLTDFILSQRDFDAYEVLGGEVYFQQNGFQTLHYYDAIRRMPNFPIVGSSDTHGTRNNPAAFCAATVVFAQNNDAASIMEAIRARNTVCVDYINPDTRVVGSWRLSKYAYFLLENYFPLQKEACFEEARAMREYIAGDREEGAQMIRALQGRTDRLRKKYFDFEK